MQLQGPAAAILTGLVTFVLLMDAVNGLYMTRFCYVSRVQCEYIEATHACRGGYHASHPVNDDLNSMVYTCMWYRWLYHILFCTLFLFTCLMRVYQCTGHCYCDISACVAALMHQARAGFGLYVWRLLCTKAVPAMDTLLSLSSNCCCCHVWSAWALVFCFK